MRKLSTSSTNALLAELERDPDIVTFLAYNDFPYKGKYPLPKTEREYWLQISRAKLSASVLARYPALPGGDDLLIMHVHYADDWPWPGDNRRRKVDLPHRKKITQINVRHTWQGSGAKSPFPCKDPGGALDGTEKEAHGCPVLVADTGWNWTVPREKD